MYLRPSFEGAFHILFLFVCLSVGVFSFGAVVRKQKKRQQQGKRGAHLFSIVATAARATVSNNNGNRSECTQVRKAGFEVERERSCWRGTSGCDSKEELDLGWRLGRPGSIIRSVGLLGGFVTEVLVCCFQLEHRWGRLLLPKEHYHNTVVMGGSDLQWDCLLYDLIWLGFEGFLWKEIN